MYVTPTLRCVVSASLLVLCLGYDTPNVHHHDPGYSSTGMETEKETLCRVLGHFHGLDNTSDALVALADSLLMIERIEAQVQGLCKEDNYNPCEPNPCGAGGSCTPFLTHPICYCGLWPLDTNNEDEDSLCLVECKDNSQCGSGETCVKNECKNMCHDRGTCGEGTVCMTMNNIPVCACKDGYYGWPDKGCYLPTRGGECGNEFYNISSHCYYFSEIVASVEEAEVVCSDMGASLIALENEDEYQKLLTFMRKNTDRYYDAGPYLTSLKKVAGAWKWHGKVTATHVDWAEEEPNVNEGFTNMVIAAGARTWKSIRPADLVKYLYICERVVDRSMY